MFFGTKQSKESNNFKSKFPTARVAWFVAGKVWVGTQQIYTCGSSNGPPLVCLERPTVGIFQDLILTSLSPLF